MLDYELTFEFRLSDPKADSGVIVRSSGSRQGWPAAGYRVRLPGATIEPKDVFTGRLDPDLDRKALEAVRQWRFRPATRGGEPVATLVIVEMSFVLREKK